MLIPRCRILTKGNKKAGTCAAIYDICSAWISGDVVEIEWKTGTGKSVSERVLYSDVISIRKWE